MVFTVSPLTKGYYKWIKEAMKFINSENHLWYKVTHLYVQIKANFPKTIYNNQAIVQILFGTFRSCVHIYKMRLNLEVKAKSFNYRNNKTDKCKFFCSATKDHWILASETEYCTQHLRLNKKAMLSSNIHVFQSELKHLREQFRGNKLQLLTTNFPQTRNYHWTMK